jgi:gas vesicle protein
MADETTTAEEELVEELSEERTGAGPGFILGTVLGILAGAAAATLFAPATGEEFRHRFSEHEDGESAPRAAGSETPVERVRTLLTRVRSRMKDATAEGREAAHEAEEEHLARYAELTKND